MIFRKLLLRFCSIKQRWHNKLSTAELPTEQYSITAPVVIVVTVFETVSLSLQS